MRSLVVIAGITCWIVALFHSLEFLVVAADAEIVQAHRPDHGTTYVEEKEGEKDEEGFVEKYPLPMFRPDHGLTDAAEAGADCCSCCLGDVERQFRVGEVESFSAEKYALRLIPVADFANSPAVLRVGFISDVVHTVTVAQAQSLWWDLCPHMRNASSAAFITDVFNALLAFKEKQSLEAITTKAAALERRNRRRASILNPLLVLSVPSHTVNSYCDLGDLSVSFEVVQEWSQSLQSYAFSHEEDLMGFALGLVHDQGLLCWEIGNLKSVLHPSHFVIRGTRKGERFGLGWNDFRGFSSKGGEVLVSDREAFDSIWRYIHVQRRSKFIEPCQFNSDYFWSVFDDMVGDFSMGAGHCELFTKAEGPMHLAGTQILSEDQIEERYGVPVAQLSEYVHNTLRELDAFRRETSLVS